MASSGFDPSSFFSGSGGSGPFGYQPGSYTNIFQGLFGHPERPYASAERELDRLYPETQSYQRPYLEAGNRAIPNFERWLSGMQDPTSFINKLMGNYQESPFARFQQEQGLRAAQNMGSTGESPYGGAGSTPLMQFAQKNAQNISSQDMSQWLQNVLGINTQYGAGQESLIGRGQTAANALSELARQFMSAKASAAFGKGYAGERKSGQLISGLTGLFGL